MPSFLFRRLIIVFLWVSRGRTRKINEKMVKNIIVHCVQRQLLRTVTNEPMTGLLYISMYYLALECALGHTPKKAPRRG
jgi:hypothetical protein